MATPNLTSVFITGANTGLGLEIVRALCRSSRHYNIIVGSRRVEAGETAVASVRQEFPDTSNRLTVVQIDVESDESIERAYQHVSTAVDGRLDVLINNAGASFDRNLYTGTTTAREVWRKTWDVNVVGSQLVTETLMPLLVTSRDPRLLFITSGTSTLAETLRFDTPTLNNINAAPPPGWPKDPPRMPVTVYRASKTGLNMLMREWDRILRHDGVKVWCVSPGFLATGLAGVGADTLKQFGALDPSDGGNFVRDVVEGQRDADAGRVIRVNDVQPW